MSRMPIIRVLLLLTCSSVSAHDTFPAPEDLQISVPVFGKVNLSWKKVESGNIFYIVKIKTPETEEKENPVYTNFASYDFLALHGGVTVKVAATRNVSASEQYLQWASKELPPAPGEEGTAAEQLKCQIIISWKGESFLNCDWLPGKRAPLDAQYYLYYRYTNLSEVTITQKCLQYVTEAVGRRHTGCRMQLHYKIQNAPENIIVLVNGSSRTREIRATDAVLTVQDIEEIPPVQNFSCTTKGKIEFRWSRLLTSMPDSCFSYEVNFWSKQKNHTSVTVRDTYYWHEALKEPSNKTHVRVRAVGGSPCWYPHTKYSQWSEVLDIGGKDDGDVLWGALWVCLFVASLALFLCAMRFWRRLFPQIPKPKVDLRGALRNTQQQALMRCNSWDTEEVISGLEVLKCPDGPHKLPLDYTYLGD